MYTKIDALMWSDCKYRELTDDGKLLFVYVLTCNHRNMLGIYHLPIPYGAYDLNWDNKRFSKGLEELLQKGLINYNSNTNIILIPNFLKYNPLENQNQVKGAIKAISSIPTIGLNTELLTTLKAFDKPFVEPLIKLLEERLGKQEKEEEEEEEEKEEETIEEEVEEIKKTTPKKIKFGEFKKVSLLEIEYQKLIDKLGQVLTDDLIVRLDNYKASTGKNYKSDYATILNWSRKEPINNNSPKKSSNPFLEMMQDELDKNGGY
ncbi:hypothetical protein [Paratissierella segnis]|uniref:Replication protein n=1 Tax=Paratissierella segnis TaxID=2763679 RepID=A0A926IJI2_9FIRM|nr:hypothetical protein [Paratissierella segnis]MBC8588059.1 hypothetical protein [Paratissierella segnis]